jgi:hypothetical protein
MFQQDGAPAQTANSMQRFRENNMVAQWSKEFWPPFSPDLNLLDYSVWGALQTIAYENANALRHTISCKWKRLSKVMVWCICRMFRPHPERVVAADGGYID